MSYNFFRCGFALLALGLGVECGSGHPTTENNSSFGTVANNSTGTSLSVTGYSETDSSGGETTSANGSDSGTGTGMVTVSTTQGNGNGTENGSEGDSSSSTSSSSTASSSSGVSDSGELVPCDVVSVIPEIKVPQILLTLDRSGSMTDFKWDHDNDPNTEIVTRWASLYMIVESVVAKFENYVAFGVRLFPEKGVNTKSFPEGCKVSSPVESPIAIQNAKNLLDSIPDASVNKFYTVTPLYQGVSSAISYLGNNTDPSSPIAQILISDGRLSCSKDGLTYIENDNVASYKLAQDTATIIELARNNLNTYTYVVGIDVDDAIAADHLNLYAEAGGKITMDNPKIKYYDAQNHQQLLDSIQQIVSDNISCEGIKVPEPSEPELFELEIDDNGETTTFKEVQDCQNEDGFKWTTDYTELKLCGQACELLKKPSSVKANYFCTPG